MRRSWKTAVLGVMLAGVALVFGPSPGRANDINWRQAQGTELRLLALRAWFTDHWRANLAEFEQLTGIKVIIEDYPEDPFRQKLAVEMAGKSKNVDVFTTGTMREGRQFANLGWYADLSPMIADASLTARSWDKDDFIDAVWKAHQFGGRQVAVPIQANVQLLYFRKDLFDAAGLAPPRTLEELEAAARRLHNPPSVFGFVSRGRRTQAPYSWSHWLFANGGSWATPDGKPAINSPAGIAATEQYVRLLRNYGDPGAADAGPAEVQTLFLQGRAAMILDAVSWAGLFSDPARSRVAGRWAATLAPPGPAGATYELWAWSLAISPFSDKQRAAWLFVQWATSKEIQRTLHLRSFPMPRTSLWNDAEWRAMAEPGFYAAALAQVQAARPIGHPPFIASPEITDVVGIAINNALSGRNIRTELDAAARRMTEVIERTEPRR